MDDIDSYQLGVAENGRQAYRGRGREKGSLMGTNSVMQENIPVLVLSVLLGLTMYGGNVLIPSS